MISVLNDKNGQNKGRIIPIKIEPFDDGSYVFLIGDKNATDFNFQAGDYCHLNQKFNCDFIAYLKLKYRFIVEETSIIGADWKLKVRIEGVDGTAFNTVVDRILSTNNPDIYDDNILVPVYDLHGEKELQIELILE